MHLSHSVGLVTFSSKKGQNYNQNIVHQIKQIIFPQVIELHLKHNQIASIEPLSIIFMPNLRTLGLGQNFIANISPFRKANMKKNTNLDITGNFIKDLMSNSESNLPILQEFHIQYPSCIAQLQDIAWIFKTNSKQLRKVYLKSVTRISQIGKLSNLMLSKFLRNQNND